MTAENFIKKIKRDGKAYGVKVIISKERYVIVPDSSLKVNGYFFAYGKRRELVVATGNPNSQWLHVLLHESCHMDQYIENSDLWNGTTMRGGNSAFYVVEQWVNGKKYAPSTIVRAINSIIALERDCEERSIEKINKLKLPLKQSIYVRKANSYIIFFTMIYFFRRWYLEGKEPYRLKSVWGKMPTELISDFWNNKKYLYLYKDIIKSKKRNVDI